MIYDQVNRFFVLIVIIFQITLAEDEHIKVLMLKMRYDKLVATYTYKSSYHSSNIAYYGHVIP